MRETLTGREEQVLWQLSLGATTAEIAQALSISPHTVKVFIEHIFVKYGVHTRAGAVGKTFRQGDLR